jgi:TatD DNase family protein
MMFDTHCHIHESNYPLPVNDVLQRAKDAGVNNLICVGTNVESSEQAIEFASKNEGVYASVGIHPHDTSSDSVSDLSRVTKGEFVAVGEIGLDYYYNHSPREIQIKAFEQQIELALKHDLPIIFHVRDAFDDFWPIIDNFGDRVRGVLHSFTDTANNAKEGMKRGYFIGVNGISVFSKDAKQQQMFAELPLEKLLLETDAPFLTPPPFRGKVNEPAFLGRIAEHHATIRQVSVEKVAQATTNNAKELFQL